MSSYFSSYPSRTFCDVLEDMRRCDETKNYASMLGLIQEIQMIGNRMEAGLEQQNDFESCRKRKRSLQKEYKNLTEDRDNLEEEIETLKKNKTKKEKESDEN